MISRDAVQRSLTGLAVTLREFATLFLLVFGLVVGGLAAAAPPAPTPLGPVNGANVTVPATMSWSAVTDPTGAAITGYNWKVSASPGMAPLVFADSTNGTTTQDTLSGLVAGLYFWQVQAVSNAGQSPWSAVQSFNVTGAGPGTPGTPVLNPTRGYSTFHPFESIHFSWSAVPGAPTYRLEVSNDRNFPLGPVAPGVVTFWNENIRGTTDGFVHHPSLGEGTFFARVFATDSDFVGGIRSLPSNVIQYTVFYNNPIGPAPVLVSPIAGETLTLPITLRWEHVPNPQAMGYVWEVAKDATFTNIEAFYNQNTEPFAVLPPLTPGPKFWRVLSQHGLSSLNPQTGASTNANTEWSATGRFTVSAAPAVPVAITAVGSALPQSVYSGPGRPLGVQLSAIAPAGGAAVALTSSNPALVPVPASITVGAGLAENSVAIPIGQVTTPTPVQLTATLNGVSISRQLTVLPPTLNDDPLQPTTRATGGATMFGNVDLEGGAYRGVAPPGGFIVNLSTNSPAAVVPNSVTIPAGGVSVGFSIQTNPVPTSTVVTITATAGGKTTQWPIRLEPGAAPTSFFVRPMSTTNGSQGVVTAGEGGGFDQLLMVTSSNPALAAVPSTVTASAGSGVGFFDIVTAPVTASSVVTISVSGGGVTRSVPLTLYPTLPALSALTVNPTSVAGGATATGSVRLASAAPAGGVGVNLWSNLPLTVSVPPSVTVPAGATTATFTVTTFPSALTTVQLSANLNNVFQFASITVGPATAPPPAPTLSAVSLSPASVTGGTSSTGSVTLSGAAPSGGAVVSLSDNSAATTVPASVTVPAGASSANFTVTTGSVAAATTSTVAAAFGGVTRTAALTVNPPASPPTGAPAAPTLLSPAADARPAQPVTFDWSDVPNATSYEIQIDDSSTIAAPFRASQVVNVSQASIGGLPAQRLWWRVRARNSAGVFGAFSSTRRFEPQAATAPPAVASLSAVSVNPASVVGPASSTGSVSLTAAAPTGGAVVALASSNPAAASVPASVTVAAGASSASFSVTTSAVAANTAVTLTGSYNGTSRAGTLTVTPVAAPPPAASLNTLVLNPGTVTGGATSQGSVTLTTAAPAGGAVVTLSDNSTAATVPASITVPAGATGATFTVTTSPVTASTAAAISAVLAGVTRTATLTVNPPGTGVTLTVSASGRSGERVTSSPAGINVAVGSSGSAGFATGTAIVLSVSNGRDAIWSGACSSGGNKARTCTFTINGNASVSANVQ